MLRKFNVGFLRTKKVDISHIPLVNSIIHARQSSLLLNLYIFLVVTFVEDRFFVQCMSVSLCNDEMLCTTGLILLRNS